MMRFSDTKSQRIKDYTLYILFRSKDVFLELSLDSVLSLWESNLLLSLLFSDSGSLELGQSSSQSSGLLGSQVLWLVLLTLVQLSDSFSLLVVQDGQDTGNVLSDSLDLWQGWS